MIDSPRCATIARRADVPLGWRSPCARPVKACMFLPFFERTTRVARRGSELPTPAKGRAPLPDLCLVARRRVVRPRFVRTTTTASAAGGAGGRDQRDAPPLLLPPPLL